MFPPNQFSNLRGGNGGELSQQEAIIQQMNAFTESCPFKGLISAGGGFVMGGAMGLFFSSFEYSNPTYVAENSAPVPLKTQLKDAAKDMGRRSYSMGKGFAKIGAIYATTECIIESYRAKHDIVNSISAGCISGGILAASSGPQAAAFGCAGFAAFSAAIDYFLEH